MNIHLFINFVLTVHFVHFNFVAEIEFCLFIYIQFIFNFVVSVLLLSSNYIKKLDSLLE